MSETVVSNLDPNAKDLDEIIREFDDFRVSFRDYRRHKELNKDTLHEFEHRLADLKADLRPHRRYVAAEWQKRDDKAATGIKFRLAVAIERGDLKDESGTPLYDANSINQAEKFASGSQRYKEFLDQRTFYKESYVNVNDLRNDIETFINLIKDILKGM